MNNNDLRLSPEDRIAGQAPKRGKSGRGRPPRPERGQKRPRRRRSFVGHLFRLGVTLCFWGGIAAIGLIGYFALQMPSMDELAVPERPANVMVVAADGRLVGNRGETGGEAVRLFELPSYVPEAVMAIEDRRFYEHFGIDVIGLGRAMLANLQARGVVEGGSTLTQQLAKNLFLEPDRTIERKIQEVLLALWLEREYSKDEILEMYLNRVYLGAGATGVEAAAQRYYDKSARDLSLAEAATIAGLLKAPSRLAPTNNPEAAAERSKLVLNAMVEEGFISQSEAVDALAHPAEVKATGKGDSRGYAADWVMNLVPAYVGKIGRDIVVETTLDLDMQVSAESALKATLDEEGAAKGVSQGAVVVMTPEGSVKALVGGRDYVKSQFNRAVEAKRQPGSAFKPFVYVAAMELGLTPETLRRDAPISYGNWTPANYAGKYRGAVTLTEALRDSINTVAVQLASEVGPERVIDAARRMGIREKLAPNLSIALGTSEVSPLDLVAAYAPFSNGGIGVVPHVITRIRTTEGDVLYERQGSGPGRVISKEVVGEMNYMMNQTVSSGTGRNAAFGDWPAAGKTGTSQESRDAWFVGYTAHMVAGVWMGNDDSKPTKGVTGGSLPAKVWQKVMAKAHEGVPVTDLPEEYVPHGDSPDVMVDNSLPWLQGNEQPQPATAQMQDPAAPVQPAPSDGGFFNIDRGFLGRIFGG
ncbi:transglycosylase domain-containing protein [Lutibaculum baratangense]|uniref:Multimodular transpeptidase-transglycosylase n=1 Tax=Lutibaculum baratangense AMV1 TaxID=631454 RepID=V4R140_9HYPH|nr:penicillin-binding protein 1A [Lutibaculum baratangense]ESR25712.1 Multimodular transpeptidase-transglycosylase [Lutibaculum baratangense AMV1]